MIFTERRFLEHAKAGSNHNNVKRRYVLCWRGVQALALETPIDTGKTAMSWGYEIVESDGRIELIFTNSSQAGDSTIPVVLLIEYGHATRNGGYVAPYDFINLITQELMQEIADSIWREVTRK